MTEKKKDTKKRNALGRGLGALLDDSHILEQGKNTSSASAINEISLSSIETNPFQPRTHFEQEALQELAESIKIQGIIQPITVRKLSVDKYQLISGERRFHASKMAGLEKIPAFIRTANDQQMLEMALIENIQRENLNALEIALSYQRLMAECDLKQEELGDRVGKKRTTVTNYLRLLKLPPAIQAALREKKLSMGHARALISVESIDKQLALFNKIITEDLSVRKVEQLVQALNRNLGNEQLTKKKKTQDNQVKYLQEKLCTHFGTKVVVNKSEKNKGEIKIPFYSIQDLNRLLEILEVKI